jgi:hypothetical protein
MDATICLHCDPELPSTGKVQTEGVTAVPFSFSPTAGSCTDLPEATEGKNSIYYLELPSLSRGGPERRKGLLLITFSLGWH